MAREKGIRSNVLHARGGIRVLELKGMRQQEGRRQSPAGKPHNIQCSPTGSGRGLADEETEEQEGQALAKRLAANGAGFRPSDRIPEAEFVVTS